MVLRAEVVRSETECIVVVVVVDNVQRVFTQGEEEEGVTKI